MLLHGSPVWLWVESNPCQDCCYSWLSCVLVQASLTFLPASYDNIWEWVWALLSLTSSAQTAGHRPCTPHTTPPFCSHSGPNMFVSHCGNWQTCVNALPPSGTPPPVPPLREMKTAREIVRGRREICSDKEGREGGDGAHPKYDPLYIKM